jgi:WhiB family redox-sensing transcriptional regulator
MRSAACANVDPELFFPATSRQPATEAKQVCSGCPVKAECLEYSLVNEEEFGVWGGLTEKERRQLLNERQRHHDGHGQQGTPDPGATRSAIRHARPDDTDASADEPQAS